VRRCSSCSAVSFPSAVPGGALNKRFSCILDAPDGLSCNLLGASSGGGAWPLWPLKSVYKADSCNFQLPVFLVFLLHRLHAVRTCGLFLFLHVARSVVCVSVCWTRGWVVAKTDESIKMSFRGDRLVWPTGAHA